MTSGSSRWGAPAAASANLEENSPKTRCWLRRSTSPNVAASQNTVVPPLPSRTSQSVGQARTARASPSRTAPTTGPAPAPGGGSCPGSLRPAAASAATASGRTFEGPDPKRPSRGQQARTGIGSLPGAPRSCATLCQHRGHRAARISDRIRPSPNRPRWPSTPRPRRSRPPVRTSSASAPASPTSRHRRTSSRPPCRRARDPRLNHRYTPAGGLPELREAIAAKTKRDCGFDVHRRPGARHQRRQARRLQRLRRAGRPGRRGDPAPRRTGRPTPRPSGSGRWRAGGGPDRRADRASG